MGGEIVSGKSEGIGNGGGGSGGSGDGVFREEGAGVVGAGGGGKGSAEGGVAGNVVGGVGGVAEEPGEGGSEVKVEFGGVEWGFEVEGEGVEVGGVVFRNGGCEGGLLSGRKEREEDEDGEEEGAERWKRHFGFGERRTGPFDQILSVQLQYLMCCIAIA